MKILHVIPSLSPLRGGPSFVLGRLAPKLVEAGHEVHIAATDDAGRGRAAVPLGRPLVRDGVTIWYFARQTGFYTFSWPLTVWLGHHVGDYDLVHIHALFSYPTLPAACFAVRGGVPYIVRPLGTLGRWGLRNRRPLLKRLSLRLIEGRIIANAAAVHYISERERAEAEEVVRARNPVVIPVGIEASAEGDTASPEPFLARYPQLRGCTIALFMSRLHPVKGLDLLLPAFARVCNERPEARLVLAGPDDPAAPAEAEIAATARVLGIEDRVVFAGFLEGREKAAAISAAAFFVLPSYSESFSNAALEALAVGLPVVISDRVGISPDVEETRAGLVVPCEVEALAEAMCRLAGDAALRARLGENGKRLASERFSWDAVTRDLTRLYASVAGKETGAQQTGARQMARRKA